MRAAIVTGAGRDADADGDGDADADGRAGAGRRAAGEPPGDGAHARGVLAPVPGDLADAPALARAGRAPRAARTAGDTVLEIGAGSGLWTRELAQALPDRSSRRRCSTRISRRRPSAGASDAAVLVGADALPAGGFDYVIGTAILSHDRYQEHLDWVRTLLRPGGQLLFFEANYWNPQVFAKTQSVRIGRWSRNAECQIAMRKAADEAAPRAPGLHRSIVVPYDIVHARTPSRLVRAVQSAAFVAEHLPARARDVRAAVHQRSPARAHGRAGGGRT